jgi:hypothetical protein
MKKKSEMCYGNDGKEKKVDISDKMEWSMKERREYECGKKR